jgi:predicted CXXCH cytochrome family protein
VAQISGSAHDFSQATWSSGRICEPCHVPHTASISSTVPLWGRPEKTTAYTLYNSPTMEFSPDQPGEYSTFCLSCHDGTVALNSYGGQTGSTYISGDALIGTDLSDDHPVGLRWAHQDTESGNCSNCHNMHMGGTGLISELPFFGETGNKKIECATCHDPHGTAGYPKLLRKSKTFSELCFHCHTK